MRGVEGFQKILFRQIWLPGIGIGGSKAKEGSSALGVDFFKNRLERRFRLVIMSQEDRVVRRVEQSFLLRLWFHCVSLVFRSGGKRSEFGCCRTAGLSGHINSLNH